MKAETCEEMWLLIQADVDGELTPADAAVVAAHLEHCPSCAKVQMELLSLSDRVRHEATYHTATDKWRAALDARLAAVQAKAKPVRPGANDNSASWRQRLLRPSLGPIVPFGGGFALAAGLVLAFLMPTITGLPNAVVSDHIRALQPGHLMDVVSTDQHTVKPWFDGRLDFAPPVKDLKEADYPLTGGRLDYLADRQVAVLIYQHGKHIIDLYVWLDGNHLDHAPTDGMRSGYNYLHWTQNGMTFWVVSDLDAKSLSDFVKLWRSG